MEDLSLEDDVEDGMEEAACDPPMPCPYEFKYLQDPDEIRECMNKFKQASARARAGRGSRIVHRAVASALCKKRAPIGCRLLARAIDSAAQNV